MIFEESERGSYEKDQDIWNSLLKMEKGTDQIIRPILNDESQIIELEQVNILRRITSEPELNFLNLPQDELGSQRSASQYQNCQAPAASAIKSSLPLLEQESIMRMGTIKQKSKKNTNIPKFLGRIFLKHCSKYGSTKREPFLNSNKYGIDDVLKILKGHEDSVYSKNREIMSRIISERLAEEVIKNGYVKKGNKLSYLIAAKVYRIRCRSKQLITRIQSK